MNIYQKSWKTLRMPNLQLYIFLLTDGRRLGIIISIFKQVHAVNEKETDGKLQRAGVW